MFFHHAFNRLAMLCAAFAVFISQLASAALLPAANGVTQASPVNTAITLDVFKSPTCLCCEKWIAYLQAHGFQTTVHHPADLNQEKVARGVAPKYQSCHTAVSKNGYVFEGHIPAAVIQRFLTEKPKDAIGLAVPGMPMGSPGMEMGDHFNPYDVLLLKADGSNAVYAQITSIDQQH